MHQAVVEVGTNICHNIQEAREEVTYLRKMILDLAEKQNLQVAAAGTHPFADWVEQLITPDPRYDEIIDEMRDDEFLIEMKYSGICHTVSALAV